MVRGNLDLSVPWLCGCRDCGKPAVIWAVVNDGGEDEVSRPLDGVCGRPDRCGARPHGLTHEVRTDVVDALLAETGA